MISAKIYAFVRTPSDIHHLGSSYYFSSGYYYIRLII